MTFSVSKHTKNFILSACVLGVFALLMMFGLKRNANFTPSQLIGHSAPSFKALNSIGQSVDFSPATAAGKWTVINFWSSSCYVCREEAKTLQDFYQTVSLVNKKNPQLLSVNIQDDTDSIRQWQKEFAQTFPVVQDTQGLISLNYGVTGTPETFIVNPENNVRFRIAGAVTKKMLLHFIEWLSVHPTANEQDTAQFFSSLSSES